MSETFCGCSEVFSVYTIVTWVQLQHCLQLDSPWRQCGEGPLAMPRLHPSACPAMRYAERSGVLLCPLAYNAAVLLQQQRQNAMCSLCVMSRGSTSTIASIWVFPIMSIKSCSLVVKVHDRDLEDWWFKPNDALIRSTQLLGP